MDIKTQDKILEEVKKEKMSIISQSISSICTTTIMTVFIVLKVVGVINWSWLWVLSPLWITVGVALIMLIVLLILIKKM